MKTKFNILLIALLGLTLLHCQSQIQSNKAQVDDRASAIVGTNITIRSEFKNLPLVEPHISAHPGNNNHLLVAAMVVTDINNPYESCRLSSFVSVDNGETWQETQHDWWDYDPWTAILPDGNTVMSWIGTPGKFKDEYPIQFFLSKDGGISWEEDVQTLEGGYDGTKVTALNNAFYFTTVRFREDMGADVVLCERVGNEVFTEVAVIDGKGERLNFCEPAILTSGKVIVPASNFLKTLWVQIYDPLTKQLSNVKEVTTKPGGAKGYMRLIADANNSSPFKNHVYFVRALGAEQKYEGIWLNISTDGGLTWQPDTRIDLFTEPFKSKAMAVSAAVNKNGVLGISWVDSQHDETQQKHDLYFTLSLDGGKSFQKPIRITDISSDPKTPANADVANKFFAGGHYLGLAAKQDGSFQLAWSDSRSGIFELQTCNVKVKP